MSPQFWPALVEQLTARGGAGEKVAWFSSKDKSFFHMEWGVSKYIPASTETWL